jgi:transposase-like protein
MATSRRRFTVQEKLAILEEADKIGITPTLRKHNLSNSVFNRWRDQFNEGGASNMVPKYHRVDPDLRTLEQENARLKKIIADQALELEFKTELLKRGAQGSARR